ncbi:MAG: hypothetical protein AAF593_07215 [Planctomycetota bacterium]
MQSDPPTIQIGRCYERSPKPIISNNGEGGRTYISPDGRSQLIYHDPWEFAMGASVYRLRIEIDGKAIPMPQSPYGQAMSFHDSNPDHNPWSFDGRFAFFHEHAQQVRMPDDTFQIVSQRTWCVDTHADPSARRGQPHYWFKPRHTGRWSPNDYRVVSSEEKQIIVGHPLTDYRATWRRFFVHNDTRDWWDQQNYGWLDSGRIIWSSYRNGDKLAIVRFDDVQTGQCLLKHHVKPDDILGREADADGQVQSDAPGFTMVPREGRDGEEPYIELVEKPAPPTPPGVQPATRTKDGVIQRIHCMLGGRKLWLEVQELS